MRRGERQRVGSRAALVLGREPKRWARDGEVGQNGFNDLMDGPLYFIIEHLCVVRIYCWSLLSLAVSCNHTCVGYVSRVLVFECLPFRVAQAGNISRMV